MVFERQAQPKYHSHLHPERSRRSTLETLFPPSRIVSTRRVYEG
ncbi:hypothetical protein AKJ09_02040 [Labilithrix luteola]|uniref:Uncharacterized protein n=1 Tax=Labilithrix luteola TaxID=1391654 RepID=A0A0K1PPR9_9BACT|nr:hypothetical protein AKJ09_02040 [Labilithrix luteola]